MSRRGLLRGDGLFETSAGGTGLELLNESGGTWTATPAALPGDAATSSNESVRIPPFLDNEGNSVSCAGGQCEVVGSYATTAGGQAGLLEHYSGTTWTASPAPTPNNAASGSGESVFPESVSCSPDGGCVSVGGYVDMTSLVRPLVETITAGVATGQEAPEPPDVGTGTHEDSVLNWVSCLSSNSCTAVGSYANNTNSGNGIALIDTLAGAGWSARTGPVPSNASSGASANSLLSSVACTSRGGCEAVGNFDPAANQYGLLETYTPPEGYWTDASDGGIFSYGNAVFHGSMGGQHLNAPMVGMAQTPGSGGYWEVASDGGIFSFGNAVFHGSTGSLRLNAPMVGMAATADGGGYWLVATDGGIFNYGDAGFYGSAGSIRLNKPIVGMAATPDGRGYWLVASDGGIFNYGDAGFFGSAGAIPLNKPVVGMAGDATGLGYWLVASDGGIFTYGDAGFLGSRGGQPLNKPIVGMMSTFDGNGYWLVASDGGIFSYGDTGFYGSAGSLHLNAPMVGGTPS